MVESPKRIKNIEERFNVSIEDLLYQMHWPEDMKHREIGSVLKVPRPTITKWFRYFEIPTQSCRRFTDKNLTSWLYKTGKLKKKPRYEGPDRRIQRTKGNVNIDFFKGWSPEMAYVLGFFAADGGVFINSEGSKYIQFVSTDREILEKIKTLLNSNHKIGIKKRNKNVYGWKTCYLIQIGSKEMYDDLFKLGFTGQKGKRIRFPNIPNKYLSHFVRGYFDGDGCVSFGVYKRETRNSRKTPYLQTCFVCGNRKFLYYLSKRLNSVADAGRGSLKNKSHNRAYQLAYSANDSRKLFNFMYNYNENICYLERKYNKFKKAMEGT